MEVERVTLAEWDDLLPERGFEVFHTAEALAVLDAHSSADLRLYAGFDDGEPTALFPVFQERRSMGRALLSPPPSMGVPHMGPVVVTDDLESHERERRNRRFARAVLDGLAVDRSLTLVRVVCSPTYTDPRPFQWEGLEADLQFTYRLRADRPADEILAGFSSSLRREVSKLSDLSLTIDTEGIEAARLVYDDLADRYAEQEEPFPLTWEYVRDVVTRLEDRCRVYVARDEDGEYLAGVIVLYSNDAGYYWEGGSRATYENVSVNSLLHWRIVADIAEDPELESVSQYDFVGANTERLCRYKAKFNPELLSYSVLESAGTGMDVAKSAYQFLQR